MVLFPPLSSSLDILSVFARRTSFCLSVRYVCTIRLPLILFITQPIHVVHLIISMRNFKLKMHQLIKPFCNFCRTTYMIYVDVKI